MIRSLQSSRPWRRCAWLVTCGCAALLAGCPTASTERNAFLTLTETFGASSGRDEQTGGGAGSGTDSNARMFRRTMDVTIANTSPDAELTISMAAWVNISSIRSAEQQDALIAGGYSQLTSEIRLGVFRLPPGTFVLNGPGTAGAQRVTLPPTGAQGIDLTAATTHDFTIITPDVLLFFLTPPDSCDAPAFIFTHEGFPLDNLPANAEGAGAGIEASTASTDDLGIKTLAEIDVYQCEPLRPGLFLKTGGGLRQDNEYFEGNNVRINCFPTLIDGNAAEIEITEE